MTIPPIIVFHLCFGNLKFLVRRQLVEKSKRYENHHEIIEETNLTHLCLFLHLLLRLHSLQTTHIIPKELLNQQMYFLLI